MAKLEVKEHKKLILKKVLVKKVTSADITSMDVEIDKFYQHLKLLNVQAFGPLIVKNAGTQILEDGSLRVDYELYQQAHDYHQYRQFYETREEIVVENCLYVRFQDTAEYLQLAYSKLELYLYEHDIETDGTSYSVYVNSAADQLTVDIFIPMLSL